MKIGIIHVPKQYIVKCPPQGLMSIAAFLKGNDIRCDILDANIHFADVNKIKKNSIKRLKSNKRYTDNLILEKAEFPSGEMKLYLKEKNFDLIFIDCHFTGNANWSLRTIDLIHDVLPECKIITGGIHASHFAKDLLRKHPIDAIIKGEGEEVALKIVIAMKQGKGLENVKAVVYKEDSNIIDNAGEGFVKDLNLLPPVYDVYDEFEINKYRDYIKALKGPYWWDQDPAGVMLTSRGCIGKCTFCNSRIIDKGKYRSLKASEVKKRLEYLYKNYQPKKIGIYDAMFGGNTETYDTVVNFFKSNNVKWGFESRIDVMTVEKIKKLKDTNCIYILYGLESVNLDVLKANGKVPQNTTDKYLSKAAELFKETRKQKIWSVISILYGLPGDDKSVLDRTLQFIRENDLQMSNQTQCIFNVPIVYPGTKLWEMTKEEDRCYDWNKYFINNENVIEEGTIIYKNPKIDSCELKSYCDRSVNEVYGIKENMNFLSSIKAKMVHIKYLWNEGHSECLEYFSFKFFMLSLFYTLTQPPTSL